MSVIKRDFLPQDLHPLLRKHEIDGCVAVQADQSEEETAFLLGLAEKFDFIKGVVGWVDLRAQNLEEKLTYYKGFEKLVGFRHVLQGEQQRDFMLQDDFCKGISLLQKHGFTYDILIHADQLQYIPAFVKAFPDQPFVLDHIAKPNIKGKAFDQWAEELQDVSAFQNVYCKLSGMVTEADWKTWKQDDFASYIKTAVDRFGFDRIMYGSDWPVCLVAASYDQTIKIVTAYFSQFALDKQDKFFGGNAATFYKLN